MIRVPPFNPKKYPPSRKIVFVDPDDLEARWWWPAMIVPLTEIAAFRLAVGGDIGFPRQGEVLVCYFEDGS